MSSSSLHITMCRSLGGNSAASSDTGAVNDDPSDVRVKEKKGTSGGEVKLAKEEDAEDADAERARDRGLVREGWMVSMVCTVSTVS